MLKAVRNMLMISIILLMGNASASEDQISLLGIVTSIDIEKNMVSVVGEKIFYEKLNADMKKNEIKVGDDIYVRGRYKSDIIVAEVLMVVIMEDKSEEIKIDSSVCCDLPQK